MAYKIPKKSDRIERINPDNTKNVYIDVTIKGKTKRIKADYFKLLRTMFNKPYGTKYSKAEMEKMGFEKKKASLHLKYGKPSQTWQEAKEETISGEFRE